MVLALSVSSEIKTVGAYAGLAALLGLAILSLLYFAQARETRRLAEWIEREEQRRESAPAPVAAYVPAARASAPAPGPPPASPTGGAITTAVPGVRRVAVPPAAAVAAAGTVALAPEAAAAPPAPAETTRIVAIAAPATPAAAELAAPALEAAEPVPPERAPVAQPDTRVQPPSPAGAPAGEHAALAPSAPATDPPAPERTDSGPDTGQMDVADLPSPAAVPLAAGASPSAEPRRVKWPPLAAGEGPQTHTATEEPGVTDVPAEASPFGPSTPAGARPRFPPAPPAVAGARVDAEATVRSAGAAAFGAPVTISASAPEPTRRRAREVAPPQDVGGGNRSMASTLKLLLAAIVIVAALILVAEHVFGGSGKPTPTSSSQRTNSANTSGAPAPSTVTVSVLNGTHVTHLASTAWGVLGKLGFKQGALTDAPVQDHRITFIAFTGANRAAAVEVARDLNVAPVHVHDTIDQATLAAATATGHAPPAVIVILGANFATG